MKSYALTISVALIAFSASAHYVHEAEYAITNAVPLVFQVEHTGPIPTPKPSKLAPGQRLSGAGFWKFVAAPELVPVPTNITHQQLTNAHGTIIVDKAAEIAYWGLQGIGWVGFSNRLQSSWIIAGNAAFTNGNLHGADILPKPHGNPLVAAADNVSGKVYLSDTAFQNVQSLDHPTFGSYSNNPTFSPTDVAFGGKTELWVTDGYAQQRFTPADLDPFRWQGVHYGGGKRFSMTLHGVTYDRAHDDLLFSARPEGQIKRVHRESRRLTDIMGLPAGTKICDVDLWKNYALAACLDGAGNTPGPIYIINLKARTIAATIKPKEDLGYTDAQHMHDVAWYVTSKGKKQEVYILFTYWNPGGIGALRLVNLTD